MNMTMVLLFMKRVPSFIEVNITPTKNKNFVILLLNSVKTPKVYTSEGVTFFTNV